MFFDSREERERYVIDLYKRGRSIRDIAQEVHMSFSDIGAIIRKVTGDNRPKNHEVTTQSSKDTQAFKLFLEGKKPIDVAIALNLGSNEVERLYREYWRLQHLYKLTWCYDEIKDYLPSFLRLHRLMIQGKMKEEDIINGLKYAKELPSLENRVQQTKEELGNIESNKNSTNADLLILEKQVSKLKGDLELYQSSMHDKREEMAYLNNELAEIQSLIDTIKNGEDYQIITKVAKQEVNSLLDNKKVILSLAIVSVLEALKNDPNTRLLLGSSKEQNSFPLDDYYNSLLSDPRILQMAEEIHDKVSNLSIQNTMNWAPIKNESL
jgi:transposase